MAVTLTTPNTILGALEPKTQTSRIVASIVLVILGTLLLTASAKFKLPLPPVPFTLQTFAVALIAASAGWRVGVATVALYLIEGLSGLPVFANGGGIGYVMSPTFGFLVGYLPMAYVIGRVADAGASGNVALLFVVSVAGDAIAFTLGFIWLMVVANVITAGGGELPAWLHGDSLTQVAFDGAVRPFILWDLLKMAFAAMSVAGIWAAMRRRA